MARFLRVIFVIDGWVGYELYEKLMALSSVTEVEAKKEEGENEKEGENNGDQGGKEEKNGDKKEERKRR